MQKAEVTNRDKTKVKPNPSKPIPVKEKEKNAQETTTKTEAMINPNVPLSQQANVPTVASITAGTWTAEMENTKIRRNTLRVGN